MLDALTSLAATVGDLLGRLEEMGKSEVPFWMRMEIFSCQSRLTHARHDIAQCYHAVFGDRVKTLRKPYREMVVYDAPQLFPEFVLYLRPIWS